ncbi:pentapeptide repeat-containing protein [Pasteurella multocida]|uniref:pentapeptide repeat-containing protein n=1 Tax=Pasteurella multocida TaxID=747 RepID=UPI002024BC9D|nr:pentapeptide repeat-containing protein [Pasteurella multocida]URJ85013.1 pentapeptide repeat-containing protein [Pasteurella multocida]
MLNKFLNKLDQFFLEINDYWEDKKRKIKFWFVDKVQTIEKFSNPTKVILASLISFCIYRYFTEQALGKETSNAYWTLATLFISSPVAFIIWHFRDKNITQQIENQRKDINLKEFQKIAEWVSGLHLIEDEVTEKIANQTEQETTRKYTQQAENLSIPTFSKKDGAVGLQIAAIYNLLPFYRGEHGESFKKPALNLLLSAWLALQQKEVKNLENLDILTNRLDFDNTVKKIQENGRSPIGIAITHVLLADGGEHLVQYPEVFPNLCLAGMDFHLPGLDKNVLSLFINIKGKDCSGINLIGVNLNKSHLDGANLEKAILNGAILNGTSLNGANLEKAILNEASLNEASLNEASLNGASLNEASLNEASLNEASLNEASLEWASLNGASLEWASLNGASLNGADLEKAILNGASLNEASLNGASLNEASLEWASLNEASLEGASLNGASLEGASLNGASLNGAHLNRASLEGAIFTYDTNNINWDDLKSKGGVILYFTESKRKNYICMQLAKGENTFSYMVPDNVDIEKIQQENPDWEISIIK